MPSQLYPMFYAPGICKADSTYAASKQRAYAASQIATGRYTDCNFVRFVAGYPEKIGGWVTATTSQTVDRPCAVKSWRSYSGTPYLGIASDRHLYYWNGSTLNDITPARLRGAPPSPVGFLTNALSTSSGSTTVAVADTSGRVQNLDWVYLVANASVGGLTINGYYQATSATGTGYNITTSTAATSTVSGGGGTTAYQYPYMVLTNPFSTTNGSSVVTVSDSGHGATAGDYVMFSGASAVGGVTLSGQYAVVTVINGSTYTVTAASAATSTVSGGGGTVLARYGIVISQTTALGGNGWSLAPYGDQLLAAPIGGTIYVFDSQLGGIAYPLLNAPLSVLGMFVTPERFVVALGINGNLLEMAWPDQSDYTDWTSASNNTAESGRTLQGGSFQVGGVPVADGISIFGSDSAMFAMQYTGDNNVYATPLIADNCGLISSHAIVAQGNVAYWMSDKEFWTYNGSVAPLPSDDIRDYVFQNINRTYQWKSFAGLNRAKKEIWFFYPSATASEIDSYVIYHIDQQCFSIGSLQRTCWQDAYLFTNPYALDAAGNLYIHESGTDANGSAMASYITAAPLEINNGTQIMFINGFVADFERQTGSMLLSVLSRNYPQDSNTVDGPYTITAVDTTPRIDLRTSGRMVGFTLESNVIGGDFRIGLPRVDAQPMGSRQ